LFLFIVPKTKIRLIFGTDVPAWLPKTVGWILFLALILLGIYGLLLVISKIIEVWKEKLLPNFYDKEEKRRNNRRKRFAEHIESEINRLNRLEEWSDYRFADLEAEVEAEGKRKSFFSINKFSKSKDGLRREKSLTKALEKSQERLILVEGDPGAGKSVALRHVTLTMARKAKKSGSNETKIPIFVNLKELHRKENEVIDRNLIYTFVLRFLNRVNDRDIEAFLDEEFNKGLRNGTWIFFFDSFDEIPEVLSATEADETIQSYANAISDFLHGMNKCRGVIASRHFRGPKQMGWPRFRILQLSEKRQKKLISNVEMSSEQEGNFLGNLGTASHAIRTLTSNPLFLGLICEHVKDGNQFPENAHSVFETYLQQRFE